jgi:hypothetical protein
MDPATSIRDIGSMGFNVPRSRCYTHASAIPGLSGVFERSFIATLAIGLLALAVCPAVAQQAQSMPGMDMGPNAMDKMDMKAMGPSMAAMADHMRITALRPPQPGDEEKVMAVVAQVKATLERYKDYRAALADGYTIANETVDQPQAHFISQPNIQEAEHHFDPTKPSALLYFKTKKQKYKLEGVMFTVPSIASEDELNERIPLSQVRWHEHVKFCAAPADKVKEYFGDHPKFGMFGSINTPDACKAAGGQFFPVIFTWMIHVFPFETDMKDIFSMNDDIPHFGTEK